MSRTSFYSRNYAGWPPVSLAAIANPESEYWHQMSMATCRQLVEAIGKTAFDAWLDEQPEPESWLALHKLVLGHPSHPQNSTTGGAIA